MIIRVRSNHSIKGLSIEMIGQEVMFFIYLSVMLFTASIQSRNVTVPEAHKRITVEVANFWTVS